MQKSTPYLGGLTVSAIALRIFAPKRVFRGISGGRWAAFLGAAASGVKLLELSIRAFRREIPVGRVLLPAILFVELLRISLAGASRAGLIVCATVFEACLIVFALTLLRRAGKSEHAELEDHYQKVFAQFLPQRAAAFAACELVLLWEGLRWAARGFRRRPVSGFGYLEQSLVAMLPILLPIVSIGDEIVLGAFLSNQALWLRLGVVGLDLWAILYVFGIYATCQSRTHKISHESIRLYQGIFGRCEFAPSLLAEFFPCSPSDLPRKEPGTARLALKGAPVVRIRLTQPVTVRRMLGRDRTSQVLLVSADDPAALCRALREAQAPASVSN